MTHQWHDTYHQHTPAHHLDPRSKLLVGLIFVFIVLLTPQFKTVHTFGYPVLLATAVLLAKIPLVPLATRVLAILPFAILMLLSAFFSHLPIERMQSILARSLLSITAMALVSLTTPFPDLLRALEQWRLPRILVLFLAFLYRYAAVLRKEAVQLERAWGARYFGRFWWAQWSKLGHVLAALIVRSYERAERIYSAMLARGFSGESPRMRLLHFSALDGWFVASALVSLSLVRWWPQ